MLFLVTATLYAADDDINRVILNGTIEELRVECLKRGLPTGGDRPALVRRLLTHERERVLYKSANMKTALRKLGILLTHADYARIFTDSEGERLVILSGSVKVSYGGANISADYVKINVSQRLVSGEGKVVYEGKGKCYFAERFFYDNRNDRGIFFRGKTSLGKFIYTGKQIRKVAGEDKYIGDDITLTTCTLKNPHYHVEANRLYYYDSKLVLITHAAFYFGHDAMVYLPFFYRNLVRPALKTSMAFRQRSGLVVQNSYYPVDNDRNTLLLMGDFYERLGLYGGIRYTRRVPSSNTIVELSGAYSNNVYYYDNVTEHWSPWAPIDTNNYRIEKSFRYKGEFYKNWVIERAFHNEMEFNLTWIKDPYYQYDFERRSEQFDPFKLIGQAEYDYPRKGSGFDWFYNDHYSRRNLSIDLTNTLRFEPQRNENQPTVSLPDYYEYRLSTINAPSFSLSHGQKIFTGAKSPLIANMDYTGRIDYNHRLYFNAAQRLSSELHNASSAVNVSKKYIPTPIIMVTPLFELGATGQTHVHPTADETTDDRQNTLVYGKTKDNLTIGTTTLNFQVDYNLNYKIVGPVDYYEYGWFREHSIDGMVYFHHGVVENILKTSYDLRPQYDWNRKKYVNFRLRKDRFSPLDNTLTVKPLVPLTLVDRLVYDIAFSRFKVNSFVLNYEKSNIYLLGRRITAGWTLDWEHNFTSSFLDSFISKFHILAEVHPYLQIYFSVLSMNEQMWKYFPKAAREQGIEPINPLVDLIRSFNFFNRGDREASSFNMKTISFGFIHDLHDWELKFDYTGNRELSYDGSRYLWNNTYSISIGLKQVKSINIHTKITERQ